MVSMNKNRGQNLFKLFQITPWDVLTGLPAGVLIFMATILISTVIGINYRYQFTDAFHLLILGGVSLTVGFLIGITRLNKGPTTALSAGLIAAGILLYLWLAAQPGEAMNQFVFGPFGMIITVIISPIGGWLGARFRKAL